MEASWISRSRAGKAASLERRAYVLNRSLRAGTNCDCAYCHKRILLSETECTVEAWVLGRRQTLHFHRSCQRAWESLD
jgi:hypothetical protein